MHRRDAGFSLIEALTTMAVIAIALTIGIPSFAELLIQHRASAARYELTFTMAAARMAAVTYRHPVSICPVDAARNCRTDGVWEQGWMMFHDPGSTGQPRNDDAILRLVPGIHDSLILRTTPGRKLARYQPDGRSGGSTITLSLCGADDGRSYGQVVLNNAGRTRVVPAKDAGLACTP